ncbi:hypothetical protein C8J56DRAFT_1027590 [Mycena floridula]|nr:hypothetical protein C8J56DRAFT_1027590 [Mycena floridula]
MAEGTMRRTTRATPDISHASKTTVKVSNEEEEEEVEEEQGGKKQLHKKRDPGQFLKLSCIFKNSSQELLAQWNGCKTYCDPLIPTAVLSKERGEVLSVHSGAKEDDI